MKQLVREVKITGTGSYLPEKVITNKYLESTIDTNADWIYENLGIKERRIAADNQATSDLASNAALNAIENAGLVVSDIDLIIVATATPDRLAPSTAAIVQDKIKAYNAVAFDIAAVCSGFLYGMSVASQYIATSVYDNVLVIGADTFSRITDWSRRDAVFFGDGAGAAVISLTQNKDEAIVDVNCSSDGSQKDLLLTPGIQSGEATFMQMKGNETFKVAVRTLTSDVKKIMAKNGYKNEDIDLFVPHQANYRIIKAVGDALKFEDEQKVLTVEKYGNTSSASIPMAINDCFESGRLSNGQTVLLDAFGGGLTWGSAIVKFNG